MRFIFYFIRQLQDYLQSKMSHEYCFRSTLAQHDLPSNFVVLSHNNTKLQWHVLEKKSECFLAHATANSIILVSVSLQNSAISFMFYGRLHFMTGYGRFDVYKCFKYASTIVFHWLMAFKFVLLDFNSDPKPFK